MFSCDFLLLVFFGGRDFVSVGGFEEKKEGVLFSVGERRGLKE